MLQIFYKIEDSFVPAYLPNPAHMYVYSPARQIQEKIEDAGRLNNSCL